MAQERDPLTSPASGAAGSRFQIVGQSGWAPGETVTISLGFSDTDPGEQFSGAMYHERQVTVLRDGTWSFPIVVNNEILPFPLWRPGFIVVKAQSATKTAVNSFVYTVEGRAPLGAPPLADLGTGPEPPSNALVATLALFVAATGALIAGSGWIRRSLVPSNTGGQFPEDYSSPISRRKASMFGARPRKPRTSSSPSTDPPRSRILRR
ncbi:MAG: hypothetical protein M3P30_14560 [Chloroflexota bacterium]|nr:hypothetical protein [Chloroflexota bacterium]